MREAACSGELVSSIATGLKRSDYLKTDAGRLRMCSDTSNKTYKRLMTQSRSSACLCD